MKNQLLIILITISSIAFTSCSEEKKADKDYEDYKEYVSETRDSVDHLYDREWNELENEYNEKKMKAEAKMNEWNEATRSEFVALQNDWEAFREKYDDEHNRRAMEIKTAAIENDILPQGIAADMSNVTTANILDVHTHFVSYVSDHRDEFTREQWDRIEFIWEALDTKKNEVEKELKSGDNLKIAEQKVKYGAIKATNRPVAKAEENAEAKDK